jgi:uncharacterized protein (TIGR03083 family)
MLTSERYLDSILHTTADLADLVEDTAPDQPVPTCPEWTFADLVAHVGHTHRRVATLVERRAIEPVSADSQGEEGQPSAAWLNSGAQRLVTALRSADLDTPVWTFLGERPAAFWARRMAHETSIHDADGRYTAGRSVSMPADLSADGISEGLDLVAFAAQRRPELRGDGETLHFHSADGWLGRDGEWFVRRTPAGIEWEHGHQKGDVAVRGNAADLFLLLTRRITPDSAEIQVLGDRALFDHWYANTAF